MQNNDLIVKIAADTSEMSAALAKAEKNLETFEHSFSSVFRGINGALSQFVVSFSAFGQIKSILQTGIAQFAQFGASLELVSRQTGVASSRLSALKYAAEQSGSSLETAADAMKTFQEQLGAAQLGDAGAIGKYSQFQRYAHKESGSSVLPKKP